LLNPQEKNELRMGAVRRSGTGAKRAGLETVRGDWTTENFREGGDLKSPGGRGETNGVMSTGNGKQHGADRKGKTRTTKKPVLGRHKVYWEGIAAMSREVGRGTPGLLPQQKEPEVWEKKTLGILGCGLLTSSGPRSEGNASEKGELLKKKKAKKRPMEVPKLGKKERRMGDLWGGNVSFK